MKYIRFLVAPIMIASGGALLYATLQTTRNGASYAVFSIAVVFILTGLALLFRPQLAKEIILLITP